MLSKRVRSGAMVDGFEFGIASFVGVLVKLRRRVLLTGR
jgi:hypothetical protein